MAVEVILFPMFEAAVAFQYGWQRSPQPQETSDAAAYSTLGGVEISRYFGNGTAFYGVSFFACK